MAWAKYENCHTITKQKVMVHFFNRNKVNGPKRLNHLGAWNKDLKPSISFKFMHT